MKIKASWYAIEAYLYTLPVEELELIYHKLMAKVKAKQRQKMAAVAAKTPLTPQQNDLLKVASTMSLDISSLLQEAQAYANKRQGA
ncbi:hypothetical protein [Balneatrix alpica]|uniref:Uncharacterized protein n=1 Tax=Balneatrix alpica TaxID=75684 RepID=A0ABV5Z9G9_9GAMM|nr:hypothetical protein [Balneatrix alpica]